MSSRVQPAAAAGDPLLMPGAGRAAREPEPPKPAPAAPAADLRLVIEEAGEPGHYVYTVVDRRTGEVISQLPREEILRLRDTSDYAAGTVFDGTA